MSGRYIRKGFNCGDRPVTFGRRSFLTAMLREPKVLRDARHFGDQEWSPSCAYDAHNPEWWKTIPREYLSRETESNCVSARTGGKQQEVSYWSVTIGAKRGAVSERDSA